MLRWKISIIWKNSNGKQKYLSIVYINLKLKTNICWFSWNDVNWCYLLNWLFFYFFIFNKDYWNSGLWIICIIDNNYNLQIVSFGFVSVENQVNDNWILKEFAKRNDL